MATALERLIKLSKNENIARNYPKDGDFLVKLGSDVVDLTEEDEGTRSDWLKLSKKAMEKALQITKQKNTPWPGASNVQYPLLTIAALQFNARAYPATVQRDKVVGAKATGADPEGKKADQGKRVADFMNWQLLYQNEVWEEQLDRILIALPIEGCEFKKTYYSPARGYNVSEWIRPIDFIVDNSTRDLESCPRMTHRFYLRPRDITERVRAGIWLNRDLNIDTESDRKEENQEFFEQHCFIDLDKDGYKEPYSVTVHKDSCKVVRIKADYLPEDITIKLDDKIVSIKTLIWNDGLKIEDLIDVVKGVKVVKIDRFQYFTKYSFFPSPDGGFYDMGFGQLINGLTDSIDTNINQLNDAGTLANNQTGFVRDGFEVNSQRGVVKTEMGAFQRVKVPSGQPIQGSIMEMPYSEPSSTLFNLLGMLVQGVKDITSVQDIFTGGQQQNETATTTLTRVEQGLKVFTAIYKRIYRSLKEEFRVIYKLNGIYLEPKTYYRVLDTDIPQVITLEDFRNDGTDVQPVGDPAVSTLTEKIAKAQLVQEQAMANPIINKEAATIMYFEALEIPNANNLIIPAEDRQPPPDPKMIEVQIKMLKARAETAKTEEEIAKTKAETIKTYAEAVEAIASAESKEAGDQLGQYRLQLDSILKEIEVRKDERERTQTMGAGQGNPMGNGQTQPSSGAMQGGGSQIG